MSRPPASSSRPGGSISSKTSSRKGLSGSAAAASLPAAESSPHADGASGRAKRANTQPTNITARQAPESLLLRVAASQAYPFVEDWLQNAAARMKDEGDALLKDTIEPAKAVDLQRAHQTILRGRETRAADRQLMLAKLTEMHAVTDRCDALGKQWVATFAELGNGYLQELAELEAMLLDRRAKAHEWTTTGAREQTLSQIDRFQRKRAALAARATEELAQEAHSRASEAARLRVAFESCLAEVRDVMGWYLQKPGCDSNSQGTPMPAAEATEAEAAALTGAGGANNKGVVTATDASVERRQRELLAIVLPSILSTAAAEAAAAGERGCDNTTGNTTAATALLALFAHKYSDLLETTRRAPSSSAAATTAAKETETASAAAANVSRTHDASDAAASSGQAVHRAEAHGNHTGPGRDLASTKKAGFPPSVAALPGTVDYPERELKLIREEESLQQQILHHMAGRRARQAAARRAQEELAKAARVYRCDDAAEGSSGIATNGHSSKADSGSSDNNCSNTDALTNRKTEKATANTIALTASVTSADDRGSKEGSSSHPVGVGRSSSDMARPPSLPSGVPDTGATSSTSAAPLAAAVTSVTSSATTHTEASVEGTRAFPLEGGGSREQEDNSREAPARYADDRAGTDPAAAPLDAITARIAKRIDDVTAQLGVCGSTDPRPSTADSSTKNGVRPLLLPGDAPAPLPAPSAQSAKATTARSSQPRKSSNKNNNGSSKACQARPQASPSPSLPTLAPKERRRQQQQHSGPSDSSHSSLPPVARGAATGTAPPKAAANHLPAFLKTSLKSSVIAQPAQPFLFAGHAAFAQPPPPLPPPMAVTAAPLPPTAPDVGSLASCAHDPSAEGSRTHDRQAHQALSLLASVSQRREDEADTAADTATASGTAVLNLDSSTSLRRQLRALRRRVAEVLSENVQLEKGRGRLVRSVKQGQQPPEDGGRTPRGDLRRAASVSTAATHSLREPLAKSASQQASLHAAAGGESVSWLTALVAQEQQDALSELQAALHSRRNELAHTQAKVAEVQAKVARHDALMQCAKMFWRSTMATMRRARNASEAAAAQQQQQQRRQGALGSSAATHHARSEDIIAFGNLGERTWPDGDVPRAPPPPPVLSDGVRDPITADDGNVAAEADSSPTASGPRVHTAACSQTQEPAALPGQLSAEQALATATEASLSPLCPPSLTGYQAYLANMQAFPVVSAKDPKSCGKRDEALLANDCSSDYLASTLSPSPSAAAVGAALHHPTEGSAVDVALDNEHAGRDNVDATLAGDYGDAASVERPFSDPGPEVSERGTGADAGDATLECRDTSEFNGCLDTLEDGVEPVALLKLEHIDEVAEFIYSVFDGA